MKTIARSRASVMDTEFYREAVAGLAHSPKRLPCKYFYDDVGSALFERICDLEEYYLTRTEMMILRRHLPEMAGWIGPQARIIEFGAGAGIKTELLLRAVEKPAAYLPVDISAHALAECGRRLSSLFPQLSVTPIYADYMKEELFKKLEPQQPFTIFFPGSTLGNFEPEEAIFFLRRMKRLIGAVGGILIGVDLMKETAALSAAYDDCEGVTAAFNKNLLMRINRELEGDFDLNAFAHRAVVNHSMQRVEMHLVSLRPQTAHIGGAAFHFTAGESIHTENSYKYTAATFTRLAEESGLAIHATWTDPRQSFAVHYLRTA